MQALHSCFNGGVTYLHVVANVPASGCLSDLAIWALSLISVSRDNLLGAEPTGCNNHNGTDETSLYRSGLVSSVATFDSDNTVATRTLVHVHAGI